ncbi:response regulator [Sphingomicrobium sp. XHP0239]|uniref:response regulator n=1 Tax=Sphingomicrobium maritimum TaxID=3133972 RepID=UPI0031CC7871
MPSSLSIMIVEDEPLIAMMLEDFLDSLGHKVLETCESVASALHCLESETPDLAILDVNVAGEEVWPVARVLRDKGIPFALATGGLVQSAPEGFEDLPTLAKPYTIDRVEPVIEEAMASANSA